MAPSKKKAPQAEPEPIIQGDFMDWKYHSETPIGGIPPTSPNPQPDLFKEYKPKKKDKLDYKISQTYCKMDAGCTKINFKQTHAEYEPSKPVAPKKKKIPKYGRGPVWEFLEEKIARKIEEMQAIYRAEFAVYHKRKVKERREKDTAIHDLLLKKAGPDWYQELSPQQLRTVDNLERCINLDVRNNTDLYSKDNIASLGLVLRPNSAHIQVALKFCCNCPVEFLLILYQVINPKRTDYSLNDRLLLSAVVHLTMSSTLKELHIRIPSPPKIVPEVKPPEKPKPPKKIKYDSPYLIPFTFKPEPRKHTGVYENKHVQHPESPYFCYLEELKCQPRFNAEEFSLPALTSSNSSINLVYEILEECSVAQAIYNKLAKENDAPYLYMPNIYPQCIRTPEGDEGVTIVQEELPPILYDETKKLSYLQAIDELQEQLIDLSQKFVIGGISIGRDGLPVYILIAVLKYKECPCAKEQRQLEKQREIQEYQQTVEAMKEELINSEKKFVISGLTNGPDGKPVFILSSAIIVRGVCPKHRRAFKEKEYVLALQENLEKRCEKFVLGGVTRGRDGKPVYEISAVLPMKKCNCGKHLDLIKELKDPRTPVEKSQDNLKQFKQKFVIGGVIVKDGFPIYIISTVYDAKECTCGDHVLVNGKVESKIRIMEMLQYKLTISRTTYIIGGVTQDPDGLPVYSVTGVKLRKELCERHRLQKEGYKELCTRHKTIETLQANLMCTGNKKFIIGGVTLDRKGKPVYIISDLVINKGVCPRHLKLQMQQQEVLKQQQNIKNLKQKLAITGVTYVGFSQKPVYIIQGVVRPRKRCWRHKYIEAENDAIDNMQEEFSKIKQICNIAGVTKDLNGLPVYIISSILRIQNACHHRNNLGPTLVIDRRTPKRKIELKEEDYTCDFADVCYEECADLICRRKVFEHYQYSKEIKKLQNRLAFSSIKYAIGGLTYGQDGSAVYIINAVTKQRECTCQVNIPSQTELSSATDSDFEPQNPDVKSLHKMYKNLKQKFCINGIAYDRAGKPVFIISNVKPTSCVCHAKRHQKEKQRKLDEAYPLAYRLAAERLRNKLTKSDLKYVNGGIIITPDGKPVYFIQGVLATRICPCAKIVKLNQSSSETTSSSNHTSDEDSEMEENIYRLHKEITNFQQRFYLGGVTYDQDHKPVFIISCVIPNLCECVKKQYPKQKGREEEDATYPLFYRLESERIRTSMMECSRKYINGGISIAPNGQPVFSIQGILPLRECPCVRAMRLKQEAEIKRRKEKEEYEGELKLKVFADEEKLVQVKPLPNDECVCKVECEKFIKRTMSNRCQCPQCKEDLEQARKIFIIEGTAIQKGDPIRLVQGVAELKDCDCLQKYRKKVERYEDLKARFEAKQNLKSLPKKYAVSGVTIGPDNKPIYILTGIAPEKQCVCADNYHEEQQRLLHQPKPFPCGSPKFIISGIKYSLDGTVYIVAGVVPMPDCDCMSIYKAWMEKHTPCLTLYDRYLEKVEKDMNKYMRELQEDEKYWDTFSSEEDCVCEPQESCLDVCPDKVQKPSVCFKQPVSSKQPPKTTTIKKTSKKSKKCKCKAEEVIIKTECTCDETQECYAMCQTALKPIETPAPDISKRTVELRRYIILSKIPCNPIAQICILKEALEVLAEDGFPLAKLPDCYMLPHFKLWMEMRCKKYWTLKEKYKMVGESRPLYEHVLLCTRKSANPDLGISPTRANGLTYKRALLYKRMVAECREKYIREQKQNRIADVREVFPATCDYEFPTKTFRDCFFAYLPAKEEDAFVFRKWQVSDGRDMSKAKKCV